MKILNPNAPSLVIMAWEEFEKILKCLPERDLIKILVEYAGSDEHDCKELTKKALIDKIFTELEEQVY